jgi:4-nitrophenyl phosphatase
MSAKLNFKAFIFDLDGSIFRGSTPIPEAKETIILLRKLGKKVLFLTNNATETPEAYSQKLSGMGIFVPPEEIITSAVATAIFMGKWKRGKVYMIGEEGLRSALAGAGFPILDEESSGGAEYVVCGLDRQVTYKKLAEAGLAIQRGAKFVASNCDLKYPTEEGYMPGAGAISSALTSTTGLRPTVIGKPSRRIMKIALEKAGAKRGEAVMVGDSLETDVRAAINAGIFSILVLTGVTGRDDLMHSKIIPGMVLDSVADIQHLV